MRARSLPGTVGAPPVQPPPRSTACRSTPSHYARRWKTLAVLSLALLIIGLDNTILNVALPEPAGALRRLVLDAAVDRRLVPARVRRPAADDGHARRPLRAQARAAGRARAVRWSQPRRAVRRLRRRADRGPRRDGHRRRADHAGDALDHHQRLPARGARQGDRHLVRHGRDRHRPRPADRRPAARVVRLDLGLPRSTSRSR